MSTLREAKAVIALITPEEQIQEIYVTLTMHGPQSISELARNAHVERTKVYRLLEDMQSLGLIEIQLQSHRNLIRAVPLSSLKPLIDQRAQALQAASDKLPKLEALLNAQTLSSPQTKVQFYRGQEGAKQMLWNQTKATTETLSILYQNMQSHTGEDFFMRWADRCNEQNLHFRSIVGDDFLQSQRDWSRKVSSKMLQNWSGRYIARDVHEIRFWTCLYDNVVAYFNWHEQEIYGIEIYNQDIADAHRNYFEMLWQQSEPIK